MRISITNFVQMVARRVKSFAKEHKLFATEIKKKCKKPRLLESGASAKCGQVDQVSINRWEEDGGRW
jgi:hypothetical protein